MRTSPSGGRLVGPHTQQPTRPVTPTSVTPLRDIDRVHLARLGLCGEDPHDLEEARIDYELGRRDRTDDYSDGRWPQGGA